MVQEIRQIMLTGDEVVLAIEAHRRVVPGFLPPGKITRCVMDEGSVLAVSIETPCNDGVKAVTFILKNFDILKPLLRFCIENNIPLPKDGRKTADIKGNAASLWVSLTLGVDMPSWVAPMQLVHLESLVDLSPGDIVLEECNA